jgi:hypothetical protein
MSDAPRPQLDDAPAGERSISGHAWRMGRFPALMPRRISEILLVSSPYDAFILEEDGLLTELIFNEYADLGLSHPPTVTHAATGGAALQALKERPFDLVIVLSRLGDMEVAEFRSVVHGMHPETPVIPLVSSEHELDQLLRSDCSLEIEDVFVWHGDAKLFVAIIKCIEDRWNIAHDSSAVGVGAIIFVEDSPQFRSALLPIMYSVLVKQSRAVLPEGINQMHKRQRMRARPKVLIADCYEKAMNFYRQYDKYLFGVIADVGFPREGVHDRESGFALVRQLKYEYPDLPALLQSADEHNRWQAQSLGADFLHKRSPTVLQDISGFMLANFGFGDFIFRQPDGHEVARVGDLRSMLRVLPKIPDDSIEYHASRNHFSNWMRARTEFELAAALRPRTVSDFSDIASLRDHLMKLTRSAIRRNRRGLIEDFTRHHFDDSTSFARIGRGSLGGKARGLVFIDALLAGNKFEQRYPDVHIYVPRSVVIGTDVFDEFILSNRLNQLPFEEMSDSDIRAAFLHAALPHRTVIALGAFLRKESRPLAVRSSSLLEDSAFHPFAGIYDTFMLPNNDGRTRLRLMQLSGAIQLVYASNYYRATRRYLENTPFHLEEQKMAVIVQPVVGRRRGRYYYPSFAGTARSINFYPFGQMEPEDGIASVALGLGSMVVEGGAALKFCPNHPQVLPQLGDPDQFINQSQRSFLAIDMECAPVPTTPVGLPCTADLDLKIAEEHGTLAPVGSVWSPDNQTFSDGIYRPGVRVVTFAHVLKNELFPLAEILRDVLTVGRVGLNAPVDVEFAVDLQAEPREFAVLQIRPCGFVGGGDDVQLTDYQQSQMVVYSPQALGNGASNNLHDIVYVKPDAFDAGATVKIAEEVGHFNEQLRGESRHSVLIGAGRWGTSNRWLGIPVSWDQISSARVIVETTLADFVVDPSQGSHFFHNLTAFGIAYLSVNPRVEQGFVDWSWLATQPKIAETDYLCWVRPEQEIVVYVDGRARQAAVFKSPPRES